MSAGEFFLASLALLFIGLKLTSTIAWPWVFVLAPLWAPVACAVGLVAAALVYACWRR